jgi:hypothetical protein
MGRGQTELTVVATFPRPKAWGVGDKKEIAVLNAGNWHPTEKDLLAVAHTPNLISSTRQVLRSPPRTEVLRIGNVSELLGAITKKGGRSRPDGSIRRLNIISHGDPGIIGLTGEVDASGNVFFKPSNHASPLDSETLDDGVLSLLNEGALCSLRDQARAKFSKDGEIALILCNGGAGPIKFTLGQTFGVRVKAYSDAVHYEPVLNKAGTQIIQRNLTSKTKKGPFRPGYPCVVSVPAGLDGQHLSFDFDQGFSPLACI